MVYANPVRSSYVVKDDDLKESLGLLENSDSRLEIFNCQGLGLEGFKEGIEWIDKKLGTKLTP